MKKLVLVFIGLFLSLSFVHADNAEDISSLKEEIDQLRKKLQRLEKKLDEKAAEPSRLKGKLTDDEVEIARVENIPDDFSFARWFAAKKALNQRLKISGDLSIIAFHTDFDAFTDPDAVRPKDGRYKPKEYRNESGRARANEINDVYVDALRLNMDVDLHDMVSIHVGLLFEDGPNIPFTGINETNSGALWPFSTYFDYDLWGTPQAYSTIIPNQSNLVITGNDTENEDDLSLDEAYISIDVPRVPFLRAIVGKQYFPFGNYDSNFLLDTLPQSIGEARDTGVAFTLTPDHFPVSLSFFTYNGRYEKASDSKNSIDTWGVSLHSQFKSEKNRESDQSLTLGLGWINNLYNAMNSSKFSVLNDTYEDELPAINAFIDYRYRNIRLLAEMVRSFEAADDDDIRPRHFESGVYIVRGKEVGAISTGGDGGSEIGALNVELSYDLSLKDRFYTLAFKYEKGYDLDTINTIQDKWGMGIATEIYENTKLNLNYEEQNHWINPWISNLNGGRDQAKVKWLAIGLSVDF